MKVVEENFRQLLQKVLSLWRKQIFVYIDEDFAINWIRPKFLSLLMTGIIRIGMTEMGSFIIYSEYIRRSGENLDDVTLKTLAYSSPLGGVANLNKR